MNTLNRSQRARFVQNVRGRHMQLHFLMLKFHENWPKVKFGSRDFSDKISIIKIHQKVFIRVGTATQGDDH